MPPPRARFVLKGRVGFSPREGEEYEGVGVVCDMRAPIFSHEHLLLSRFERASRAAHVEALLRFAQMTV